MAERLGFQLIYVNDLPDSTRSITDLANGRIYLPPASIPGGPRPAVDGAAGDGAPAARAHAARELRRVPVAATRDQLLRRGLPHAAGRVGGVPRAGQEGEAARHRGLPRRVRRHARGGGAALHEPRDEAPRHDAALPAGRRRRRPAEGLRERRAAAADRRHRARSRASGSARSGARAPRSSTRTARPRTTSTPTPRPARSGAPRRPGERMPRSSRSPSACRSRRRSGSAVARRRCARCRRAPTRTAAAARPTDSPSAGRVRRGRARDCTRTCCRRCRRARSLASTTPRCTSSSSRTPTSSRDRVVGDVDRSRDCDDTP